MMNKIYKFHPIGNKKRSYRQSKFIFSTFNLTGNSRVEMEPAMVDKAVQKMKKLGLNLIETAHSAMNTAMYALEVCEREGIDVIWQNYYLFGGFHDMFRRPTTEEEVRDIVEKTKHYKHLKGYYIWDEPWEEADIRACAEQTDWFDKYAPGKHAFSVMNPHFDSRYHNWKNGRYPWYVGHFLDTVQPPVASFDYYPFGTENITEHDGDQLDRSQLWKDIGVVRRAALERDLPLWYYFGTLRTDPFPTYHFSMTRLQVNYALMYGAKGLQSYGLAGSLVSPDKLEEKRRVLENDYEEGCFFDDMRSLIGNTLNLGKTFIALHSDYVYHGKEVLPDDDYFNEHFREEIRNDDLTDLEELPFRCSIGRLSDDWDNQYMAILNRDYLRTQVFTIPLNGTKRIYEVSKADGKHYCVNTSTDCLHVTLEPGDMAFYRVQNATDEAFDVEYIPVES